MVSRIVLLWLMVLQVIVNSLFIYLFIYSTLSAATSVNYENEKDANSTGNGHITSSQQPAANSEQLQPINGTQAEQLNPQDNVSLGSSVNYFVPSDSDIDDELQDALSGAIAPSKIPQ